MRCALLLWFLLAAGRLPGQAEPAKVDFAKQVAPILVARCIECHGPDKEKGDLRLDRHEFAFPEQDGTITAGQPDASELVRRIELPEGDDDIMPSKGAPLTEAQKALLRAWVAQGAHWPEDGDAQLGKLLASKRLPKLEFKLPALAEGEAAVIERTMAELRARGAVVQRLAADTEAIDVNLSLLRDKVGDTEIALLAPLAKRLVWLDLSRTAVSDASAAVLAELGELRRLLAANTALGDAGFGALAALPHLEVINAYGTQLGDAGLAKLASLPHLRRIYAWQSKVTKSGSDAAVASQSQLVVDLGDYAQTRLQAAEQEIREREARTKAAAASVANDKCPVTGKPVNAEFFVEHNGQRIAFCCGKCKAQFEKDPAKFADKLPK